MNCLSVPRECARSFTWRAKTRPQAASTQYSAISIQPLAVSLRVSAAFIPSSLLESVLNIWNLVLGKKSQAEVPVR